MKGHTHIALVTAAVAAALCTSTSGCAGRRVVSDSSVPAAAHEQVDLHYELVGGTGILAARSMQPFQLVGGTTDDVSPTTAWRSAVLRIRYPHPDARSGFARASLRLSTAEESLDVAGAPAETALVERFTNRLRSMIGAESSADPGLPDVWTPPSSGDDEIWILDLPCPEVDQLLSDLADPETTQPSATEKARVAIRLDGARTAKARAADARLDAFVQRVYTEGWIAGFACPETDEQTEPERSWFPF